MSEKAGKESQYSFSPLHLPSVTRGVVTCVLSSSVYGHKDFERVIPLTMGTYPLLDCFMLNFFNIFTMYGCFERLKKHSRSISIDLYPQYVGRFSKVFHGEILG